MSETNEKNGRKAVYTIIDGTEGRKARWVRIGIAFPCKDGQSWNVVLDALPVSGKLHIRDFPTREDRGGEGGEVPF